MEEQPTLAPAAEGLCPRGGPNACTGKEKAQGPTTRQDPCPPTKRSKKWCSLKQTVGPFVGGENPNAFKASLPAKASTWQPDEDILSMVPLTPLPGIGNAEARSPCRQEGTTEPRTPESGTPGALAAGRTQVIGLGESDDELLHIMPLEPLAPARREDAGGQMVLDALRAARAMISRNMERLTQERPTPVSAAAPTRAIPWEWQDHLPILNPAPPSPPGPVHSGRPVPFIDPWDSEDDFFWIPPPSFGYDVSRLFQGDESAMRNYYD